MTPVIKSDGSRLRLKIREYATGMKLGLREATHATGKGITRRVLDLTPPASAGVTGAAAARAGRQKISRQMHAVMAPVRLKGRRAIRVVFGRKLARPVYVPTKERHPDVAGLYSSRTRVASSGFGIRAIVGGAKAYVDVRKFQAVLKGREKAVGRLASGWAAAAGALDVPVQNWIGRHGASRGTVRIDTAGDRMKIVVQNLAPDVPPAVRAELVRRLVSAVEYQTAAMGRAIAGYHARLRARLSG